MTYTNNQFDRLQKIHSKLSTGQAYTFDELLTAVNESVDKPISDRTLRLDISKLKEKGAPIPDNDRSGRPCFYRKGEPFSLHDTFNPADAALASEAAALMRSVAHLPQFAGLQDVFLKFEQRAGAVGHREPTVVVFEQNDRYDGLRWLQPLYEAIRQDVQVLITYAEFDQPDVALTMSAYLLKEYNNRWHLYGWEDTTNRLQNIALDRIRQVRTMPSLRRRPDTTDWDDYLADIIGFTRYAHEPLQRWVVRVWFPRAHYVLTKCLHPSQQVLSRTDAYVDLAYELHWNREFEAALFELGPDAKLLSPQPYREKMAEKARALSARYEAIEDEQERVATS